METRSPVEAEEVVPQDGGPRTYISVKVPLFDADGRGYGVCGISTDITERKRAETRDRMLVALDDAV
jgi:PAS domain-containing protein